MDEKDLQRFKKIQKLTISSDFILLWAEKEKFRERKQKQLP